MGFYNIFLPQAVTGLLHVQVVRIMLNRRNNEVLAINAIPFANTSIQGGCRKESGSVGHKMVKKLKQKTGAQHCKSDGAVRTESMKRISRIGKPKKPISPLPHSPSPKSVMTTRSHSTSPLAVSHGNSPNSSPTQYPYEVLESYSSYASSRKAPKRSSTLSGIKPMRNHSEHLTWRERKAWFEKQ